MSGWDEFIGAFERKAAPLEELGSDKSAGRVMNFMGDVTGLRSDKDRENAALFIPGRSSATLHREAMRAERRKMIAQRNHFARQGLGVNASTMKPTHIFSRISRAADLHGGGQIGNLDWNTLFRAGLGDNSVLDVAQVKGAAEDKGGDKEKPFDMGFKAQARPPLEDAYGVWSNSKRTPADNLVFLDAATPVIDNSIKMYASGVDAPYLRSKARLMALDAAGKWDPNKSRLSTFMLSQMQPLRRAVARTMSDIKVPEAVQYDVGRMRTAEAELRDRYDRDPTDAELSEHLHMPMKRLARLRNAARPRMWNGTVLEAEEQPAVKDEGGEDMWTDFVYHDLGTTDKLIFEHRTGFNGKDIIGVSELARKLGVSAATISKRAEAIARMINNRPKGW
jgi:hypothetical protein